MLSDCKQMPPLLLPLLAKSLSQWQWATLRFLAHLGKEHVGAQGRWRQMKITAKAEWNSIWSVEGIVNVLRGSEVVLGKWSPSIRLTTREFIFIGALLQNKEMSCHISSRLLKKSLHKFWIFASLIFRWGMWTLCTCMYLGSLKNPSHPLQWALKALCVGVLDPDILTSVQGGNEGRLALCVCTALALGACLPSQAKAIRPPGMGQDHLAGCWGSWLGSWIWEPAGSLA